MPVIPNLMEQMYMLRLNRGPGPMLDLFAGMSHETAMIGLDLGVFKALNEEPATPAELADRLSAGKTGLETMLSFLAYTGYVTERSGTYRLTTMTETWLLESAETSYARYFRFWQEVLYPFWQEHAADAIRNGEPSVSVYEWLDDCPDRWPIAQSAFELTAVLLGDEIAATLNIPKDVSVLDVGAAMLCTVSLSVVTIHLHLRRFSTTAQLRTLPRRTFLRRAWVTESVSEKVIPRQIPSVKTGQEVPYLPTSEARVQSNCSVKSNQTGASLPGW